MTGRLDMRVPMADGEILLVTMEAINPLYSGEFALSSSERPPVELSGSPVYGLVTDPATNVTAWHTFAVPDASSTCFLAASGAENAPAAADPSGWWTGLLCGPRTPAWSSVTIRGGHTWTIEATATDELGEQTTAKLQPVLGVWNSTDPTGTLPTVASMPVPMNSEVSGMTQLAIAAAPADASYRFTVADAYGGGRPDFTYRARLLYGDSVTPATLGAAGGQITITGTGFATGNRVLVNGVACKVLSWTPTQIVATAPTLVAVKATGGLAVDVEVLDAGTGGSSTISGAITYPGGGIDSLTLVSAPPALATGVTAATPFAVKVLASDGATPVAGASVRVAVTAGAAAITACGAASACTLVANSVGLAQTTLSGTAAGSVTLTATELSGGATVQVTLTDTDPVRAVTLATPAAYLAAGATASYSLALQATQSGLPAPSTAITWTASGLALGSAVTLTGGDGSTSNTINAVNIAAGSDSVQACGWTTVCTAWQLIGVPASEWTPSLLSGVGTERALRHSAGPGRAAGDRWRRPCRAGCDHHRGADRGRLGRHVPGAWPLPGGSGAGQQLGQLQHGCHRAGERHAAAGGGRAAGGESRHRGRGELFDAVAGEDSVSKAKDPVARAFCGFVASGLRPVR